MKYESDFAYLSVKLRVDSSELNKYHTLTKKHLYLTGKCKVEGGVERGQAGLEKSNSH